MRMSSIRYHRTIPQHNEYRADEKIGVSRRDDGRVETEKDFEHVETCPTSTKGQPQRVRRKDATDARLESLGKETKKAIKTTNYHSRRFRVLGFGFQVSGFGFRVSGFGFPSFGLRISGFGFRVSGFEEEDLVSWLRSGLPAANQSRATIIETSSEGDRVKGEAVVGQDSDERGTAPPEGITGRSESSCSTGCSEAEGSTSCSETVRKRAKRQARRSHVRGNRRLRCLRRDRKHSRGNACASIPFDLKPFNQPARRVILVATIGNLGHLYHIQN